MMNLPNKEQIINAMPTAQKLIDDLPMSAGVIAVFFCVTIHNFTEQELKTWMHDLLVAEGL